jgi:hypothetical protein
LVARIRAKAGTKLTAAERTALLLTEVRVSQAKGESGHTGTLLAELIELNPANAEVLLELGRHQDLLARAADDGQQRASLVADARTNYQLAARDESVAYAANLALGQMLVRERRYPEALTHLQAALALKKSESLEQYASRVRRAADRMQDRKQ